MLTTTLTPRRLNPPAPSAQLGVGATDGRPVPWPTAVVAATRSTSCWSGRNRPSWRRDVGPRRHVAPQTGPSGLVPEEGVGVAVHGGSGPGPPRPEAHGRQESCSQPQDAVAGVDRMATQPAVVLGRIAVRAEPGGQVRLRHRRRRVRQVDRRHLGRRGHPNPGQSPVPQSPRRRRVAHPRARRFLAVCSIAQHFGRPATPHLMAITDPAVLAAELERIRPTTTPSGSMRQWPRSK